MTTCITSTNTTAITTAPTGHRTYLNLNLAQLIQVAYHMLHLGSGTSAASPNYENRRSSLRVAPAIVALIRNVDGYASYAHPLACAPAPSLALPLSLSPSLPLSLSLSLSLSPLDCGMTDTQ